MKRFLVFLLLVFLLSAFTITHFKNNNSLNSKDLKFVELSYGLFIVKSVEEKTDKSDPTGEHGLISGLALKKQTDTIPCAIGSQFGTKFRIETDKNRNVPIIVKWKFPAKMYDTKTNTNWLETSDTTYRPSNTETYTGYGIDESYEVLPGPWTLTIYSKNKLLYTRTFVLVK